MGAFEDGQAAMEAERDRLRAANTPDAQAARDADAARAEAHRLALANSPAGRVRHNQQQSQQAAFAGQGNDNGLFAALGAAQDFVGALGPAQQASHLAGMAKGVNKAWSDEMDSRVAQSMDARHMQHAQEMMRMQLESRERQQERDLEASRQEMLLRRLGGNSGFMIDGQGNYRST